MSETNVQDQTNGMEETALPAEETDVTELEEGLAGGDVAVNQDQIAELQRRLSEVQDRLLRSHAEFQNYRRRTEEQKRTWAQAGREEVARAILDVYDDFRRSLDAVDLPNQAEAPDVAALEGWVKGISLIYAKFSESMSRLGVEPIEAVGRAFDPDEHEAVMRQPGPEGTEPDTVLAEIQRGYRMKGRILRHAQVVVAG